MTRADRIALFTVLAYCGGTINAVAHEQNGVLVTALLLVPYLIAMTYLVWR